MKKDISRFTIKFDPKNSLHQKAIEILQNAGRRKAQLIAEVLSQYTAQSMHPTIMADYTTIATIVKDILIQEKLILPTIQQSVPISLDTTKTTKDTTQTSTQNNRTKDEEVKDKYFFQDSLDTNDDERSYLLADKNLTQIITGAIHQFRDEKNS